MMFFLGDSVDIANYVDNDTPYSIGKSKYEVENKLPMAAVKL